MRIQLRCNNPIMALALICAHCSGSCQLSATISSPDPCTLLAVNYGSPSSTAGENSVADRCAAIMNGGKTYEAQACFEKILRRHPRSVVAHTYLGMLADTRGDLTQAAKEFGIALRESPGSASVRNNYGVILARQGKQAEAARQFEASLRLNPAQASTLVNLAEIHFSMGSPENLQKAREFLIRARALDPDLKIARSLVVVDLRSKDTKTAAEDYKVYSVLVGQPAAQQTPAEMSPRSPDQRRELGDLLVAGNLPSYGFTELEAALAGNPSDPENVLHLARAQFEQKQIPLAGRTLESALAQGMVNAKIYALLAEIYEASDHIENAVPAMLLAIEQDPKNQEYRFRYGMLLVDTKAPQAGIIRLQEAVKLFPDSSRLWFGLGLAQFQDHKNEAADESFRRALRLDPKSIPSLAYLGVLALEAGRYGEAKTSYQRCIELNPKVGIVHYLLSEVIQKEQSPDLKRAEEELIKARNLDPGFAPARLALGKLYLANGREGEALTELQEAIRLQPGVPEAHYHLARAYQRSKKLEEAKGEFDVFKTLSAAEKDRAVRERKELVSKLAKVKF